MLPLPLPLGPNLCNIHRKTLVLGSFLNNVADLRPATLLKKRFQHSCFPVNIFKKTYFGEHLQTAASAGVLLEFCNNTNIYEQK